MFSVNTNLGAMAALQSLSATQSALTETQNEISTGQRVSSAADNPAVYAITQSMNGTIAGLTAVSDNLSFGAQVVTTASSSASNISSTLTSLKQTLTQAQQQGLSQDQMNQSITASLQQVNSFATSATFNGVNLISGAVGNGVTDTQLNVLTDTRGNSFTVGGSGAQALNATASGLGIGSLSTTSTAAQIAIGADSTATTAGMQLVAAGAALGAKTGVATSNTSVTLQTGNYNVSANESSSNVGQTWTFMLNDGSAAGATDVANQINASAVAGGLAAGGAADYTGSGVGTDFNVDTTNTGQLKLSSTSTNGSVTDLGNGSTMYSLVTARDANGNATQVTNVVSVNIKDVLASGGGLTDLDGTAAGNNDATAATRASTIGRLVGAMNTTGFSVSNDAKTNTMTVVGNNVYTGTGTGVAAVTNLATVGAGTATISTLSGAQGAIANVDAAITKLGTISSSLGTASQHITGMQSFTSSLSQSLTAGVGALTDADLATESAKLQSLQTKQSLGIQALSIANQQPQALLTLFRG